MQAVPGYAFALFGFCPGVNGTVIVVPVRKSHHIAPCKLLFRIKDNDLPDLINHRTNRERGR